MLNGKKIGVWGLGAVGQAAVTYACNQGAQVSVMADHLTTEQQNYLATRGIPIVEQEQCSSFFIEHDFVIPSPGIPLERFPVDRCKLLPELDLFAYHFTKPIIAVTGSIGKTSVVHLLDHVLRAKHWQLFTGGNSGKAALHACTGTASYNHALLEVSSFQLEHSRQFAPDLAIWTNFFPNHLDRHGTLEKYATAKMQILRNQSAVQQALVPLELRDQIACEPGIKARVHYLCAQRPDANEIESTPKECYLFWLDNGKLMRANEYELSFFLYDTRQFAHQIIHNALTVLAALHLLNVKLYRMPALPTTHLEHRTEYVATVDGITCINDSKATVPQATVEAVRRYTDRPVVLMLGGTSKGVDRTAGLSELATVHTNLRHIICFGAEAASLANAVSITGISTSICTDLQEAFNSAIAHAQPGTTILFSPSGASFDQFANYEERGKKFKDLVQNLTYIKL